MYAKNVLFRIFNHGLVEALSMHWRKRNVWKIGVLVGILLFFVSITWNSGSAVYAHSLASGQATPTEDATVTALNKEKLAQEVQQLKEQNAPDLFRWFQTNAAILLSMLVVVIGGLVGLFRWFGDRRDAQDKDLKAQAEERFKTAVTALGDEKEGVQVGAAILLRSFRDKSYKQYHIQIFDLAVAYLRLLRTLKSLDDPNTPLPPTPLSQTLTTVFQEFFPLARSQNKGSAQSLDATGVKLDGAFLWKADLEQVWMPQASLRGADLSEAKLSGARIWRTDLRGACLWGADLREADFGSSDLSNAVIASADLSGAKLGGATLSGANIEDALSLEGTDLRRVKGLTKEQLEACKAKGAIIDEDPTTNASQSTVAPPPPSQSNDVHATSIPTAQGSLTASDTDVSRAASSKSGSES